MPGAHLTTQRGEPMGEGAGGRVFCALGQAVLCRACYPPRLRFLSPRGGACARPALALTAVQRRARGGSYFTRCAAYFSLNAFSNLRTKF